MTHLLPAHPSAQGVHPIAREAWSSIHQIYGAGAQCYETPLVRAEWLRERADAAQVCRHGDGNDWVWQPATACYTLVAGEKGSAAHPLYCQCHPSLCF